MVDLVADLGGEGEEGDGAVVGEKGWRAVGGCCFGGHGCAIGRRMLDACCCSAVASVWGEW